MAEEKSPRVCQMAGIGEIVGMKRRTGLESVSSYGRTVLLPQYTAIVRFGSHEFELDMGGLEPAEAAALLDSGRVTITVERDG